MVWTDRRPSGVGVACANIAAQKVDLRAFKIVGQLWLREPLDTDILQERLTERLLRYRRFTSRVITPDFGCCGLNGRTCGMSCAWEDMDEVDWAYHLREHTFATSYGAPETDYQDEMNAYLSVIQETPWDMTKPLWRVVQIRNADVSRRTVILCIIDHTIGDGVSQMQTLLSVLDDDDTCAEEIMAPPRREVHNPFPWYKRASIWLHGTCQAVFAPFLCGDDPNTLRMADFRNPSGNVSVATTRPLPLARFKELARQLSPAGFSVNDVFMTVFTLTLYRYLREQNDPMTKKGGSTRFTCQIMVDVMGRRATSFGSRLDGVELQNSVAPMVFGLPFAVLRREDCTRHEVAQAVKEQIDELKVNPRALYQHHFNKLFASLTPQPLSQAVICSVAGKQTAVFSNLAGPQKKVHLAGMPIEQISFNALFGFALYFGVLTYDGIVTANVTVDKEVADARILMRYFEEEFQYLCDNGDMPIT